MARVLDGSLTPLSFSFALFDTADLAIELRDNDSGELVDTAIPPTDCTIALAALPSVGGTLTPINADKFAAGRTAVLIRRTPARQGTSFPELNRFPAETVESSFDRGTAVDQDLRRDADLAVRMPHGRAGVELLPQTGTMLAWVDSADGPVLVNLAAIDLPAAAVDPDWIPILTTPPGPVLNGYTHTQASAAATWTINHNLGRYPTVDVIIGGAVVDAAVVHASINQAVVSLNAAFAGIARAS